MTATHSDRVTVARHTVVSACLLRLATPFFRQVVDNVDPVLSLGVWSTLRTTAQHLLMRGAMQLDEKEEFDLRQALKYCPPSVDADFLAAQTFTERG